MHIAATTNTHNLHWGPQRLWDGVDSGWSCMSIYYDIVIITVTTPTQWELPYLLIIIQCHVFAHLHIFASPLGLLIIYIVWIY